MSDLLDQVVRNNAEWCSLVCATHGGDPGDFGFASWIIKGRAPLYYPNMVTLRSGCAAAQTEQAAHFTELQGIGIKDSFFELDLAPLGFRAAIQGHWICYRNVQSDSQLDWKIVSSIPELNLWERAWGGEAHVGQGRIFLPTILGVTTVQIIAGYQDNSLVAGGIVNHAGGVAGLSNVFGLAGIDDAESAVAHEAHRLTDGAPLVGWTRQVEPNLAHTLGALQVWMRDGKRITMGPIASTTFST